VKRRLIPLTAVAVAAFAGLGPAASAAPQGGTRTSVSVWFQRDAKLWLSTRSIKTTPGIAAAALERLFAAPNAAERAAGVGTAVPAGTTLRGIAISGGTATVDVSGAFAAAAGRKAIRRRLAQLTYTATQFPTVKRVRLEINGSVVSSIAGARVPQPATRVDFHRLLPPILVTRPTIGARIPATVKIAGTANVFEAALSVRILNAKGRLIALRRILASCGTGCRGTYSVTMTYHVRRAQPGQVVLLDSGGKIAHPDVVRVPVTLSVG